MEWPLAGAALVFLAAYAIPIMWPQIDPVAAQACELVVTATWVWFGVDYVVRLLLSEHRWRFVRSNVVDLLAIVLPVLRPLRLLRLIALVTILSRAGANSLRGRVVTYVVGGTVLLVFVAALAVTDAERGANDATISGFGDGLWWAIATITTVGYGDSVPVTGTGQAVAIALMIGGIAVLGVVTASIASWLVERVAAENEAEQAATRAQVELLREEITALRKALGPLQAAVDDRPKVASEP
ncbi:potassium channel family protein [Demequina pelophila]|uniref:potassium channel family protein n=1 Tax=Demequina pelophila TaxID=1638984 RepID=UPI000AEFFBFC|nr:potassium channel family protein [Demequina pelophila]